MATRRATDGDEREAVECTTCGCETERPFDPTPYVPEYAAELVNATFCAPSCAYALLVGFIDAGRPDLLELLQKRFSQIKTR